MALRSFLFLGVASTALAAPGILQRDVELPTISASAVPVAVIDDAPKPTLQPITPPESNAENLDILTPDKKVSLFYKSRPVITKRSDGEDTEDSTLAELDFKFQYPSIPLDHSSFVSTVSCGSDALTATFSDSTGFDYAQSSWPQDSKLILITSTAGCGPDEQNGLFLADSIAFSDDAVSASGSFVEVHDIMDTLNIQWGKISTPAQSNTTTKPSTDYGCSTCGPEFDNKLDASLGYYGGDDASIASDFVPGTVGDDSSNIQQRGLLDDIGDAIGGAISDGVDLIKDGAEAVGDAVSDGVGAVVDGAGELIDEAGEIIGDVVDGVIEFTGDVIDGITDALDGDYSKSVTLEIDVFAHYLNDKDYVNDIAKSSDGESEEEDEHEAPWENSYLLFSWGAEKEEGDSASAGSAKMTRDIAPVLAEREVEKSLNLYCVDCGVKGSITTTGSISLTLQGIDECKVSVNGNLEAGLFLGLEMFASFEKKYEKDLIKKSLLGWEIPNIIIFGPYASLGVEAGVEIKAEGTVLLGAKAEWTGFEATLDLMDSQKSTQSGWTPDITRKFEAVGKIGVEASLGLPVAVGVGVDLLGGKWKKGVELRDTPAIVAEAEFEVSIKHESTSGADGTETSETETDVNDGCYGVAWNIHLKNELVVAVTDVDEWPLIPEWESGPLAEGCIGYKEPEEGEEEEGSEGSDGETPSTGGDTGTEGSDGGDSGSETPSTGDDNEETGSDGSDSGDGGSTGNDSEDGTTPTTPTDPTSPRSCKGPVTKVSPSHIGSATCGETRGRFEIGGRTRIGRPFPEIGNKACARRCLNRADCRSFAFNPTQKMCTLFRRTIPELDFTSGTKLKVNDVACFETTDCPASTLEKRADDDSVQTAQVTDLTGAYKLVPTSDGNIQVAASNDTASSSSFASMEELIVGDSLGRILHYYPEILASAGASRLRLATEDALPESSEFVALVPVSADDGTEVLIAMDTEGQASYPVVCAIENVGNKVFLVADAATAEETLMAEGVREEVTGGVVTKCVTLALTAA